MGAQGEKICAGKTSDTLRCDTSLLFNDLDVSPDRLAEAKGEKI